MGNSQGSIRFKITFDGPKNGKPVFYSGQTVSGFVTLDLEKPMSMRGIHVHCSGRAKLEWYEGVPKDIEAYKNKEDYVDQETILFGKSGKSLTNDTLPEGHYQYPFSFTLPPNIPSSFKSLTSDVKAYVQYNISASIDRALKKNHTTTRRFTVIHPVAVTPSSQIGVCDSDERMAFSLLCNYEPVAAECRIPRSGFVPGERIPISVSVQNNSRRNIDFVMLMLMQGSSFISEGLVLYCQAPKNIWVIQLDGVKPHETKDYPEVKKQIPPLPPSGMPGCHFIDVDYHIKMLVKPSGFANKCLETYVPITIATVPLDDFNQPQWPANIPNPATVSGTTWEPAMTGAFPSRYQYRRRHHYNHRRLRPRAPHRYMTHPVG